MSQLDQVLASFLLTIWLVLVAVTLLRTSIAGLCSGKSWWFHPIIPSRVDRSEPAASLNETRFRRRGLELLIALTLGWFPGFVMQSLFGTGDARLNATVLAVSGAACVVHLFRSLRRFDKEGRERYQTRTPKAGQERLDSAP